MDVKLFKPPSLVNLSNFEGNTSRRPESQGSITGWSDDRGPILTKFPNKKENHPSQYNSRKETPAFQAPLSHQKSNKPITADHSYNDMRRKSGLRKIALRKESSLAAALNAASESSFKRPVVLRKLERDNELRTFPDTFSTVEFELQSSKEGFRLKSRINKRQVLDLKEITGQEQTIEFPAAGGSFSHQDVKEKTNSSPFHPKLKPRHRSIKNQDTNQSWNTNKLNRGVRNVSLSSPVYRENTLTRDDEVTKTMLNSTWAKKSKEEEMPLILDFAVGRETKPNFYPDKKKTAGPVKSVKNTYLHLTRKNFMGISMLVSSQKSTNQKGKGPGTQPAIVGLQHNAEAYKSDDPDNIELFRQYLDKITSTNKNNHGQGIFKDKLPVSHGVTLESKDMTNINLSKSVEKESRISPNALFTKGIREARIKRGESGSPKPMSAYDFLLFNSPIKVSTYNRSNKKADLRNKVTDQVIFTDTDYVFKNDKENGGLIIH